MAAYNKDEDCGNLLMVSKGTASIKNLSLLDSTCCFYMRRIRDYFDTYKLEMKALLCWLIMWNIKL